VEKVLIGLVVYPLFLSRGPRGQQPQKVLNIFLATSGNFARSTPRQDQARSEM